MVVSRDSAFLVCKVTEIFVGSIILMYFEKVNKIELEFFLKAILASTLFVIFSGYIAFSIFIYIRKQNISPLNAGFLHAIYALLLSVVVLLTIDIAKSLVISFFFVSTAFIGNWWVWAQKKS